MGTRSVPSHLIFQKKHSEFWIIARDYVEGMWKMLQQEAPEDFVLATGETHPVREFVEKAFGVLGIQIR